MCRFSGKSIQIHFRRKFGSPTKIWNAIGNFIIRVGERGFSCSSAPILPTRPSLSVTFVQNFIQNSHKVVTGLLSTREECQSSTITGSQSNALLCKRKTVLKIPFHRPFGNQKQGPAVADLERERKTTKMPGSEIYRSSPIWGGTLEGSFCGSRDSTGRRAAIVLPISQLFSSAFESASS